MRSYVSRAHLYGKQLGDDEFNDIAIPETNSTQGC